MSRKNKLHWTKYMAFCGENILLQNPTTDISFASVSKKKNSPKKIQIYNLYKNKTNKTPNQTF